MRFVGRETELKELKRVFNSETFEFVVVYGRRRVGKTTLISKACEGFKTIFHLSTKTTEKKTLTELATSVYEGIGEGSGLVFSTLDAFFTYIAQKAVEESLVLVIDEFPFMVQSIPNAMGVLQRFIDLKFKNTTLKLVLAGSSVSFMEHQVLGDKSPLYGRRSAQCKVMPFNLSETKTLYGGTEINTVLVQEITGGVPLYVSYFPPDEAIEDSIKRLFFSNNGLLYNEPLNILNREVNEPQAFFSVLELLAHGVNKLFELADKSGMSASNISYYLSTLQDIGLVDKKLPFGDANKKKTIWYIKDGLFQFYFKQVHPYRVLIERGIVDGAVAWLEKTFTTYAGRPFEEICRDYVLSHAKLPITEIGSWWGSDPRSKREKEIDIVAKTIDGDLIFGECKFTNEKVGTREYDDLVHTSMNVAGDKKRYYWIFSKSGFSTSLLAEAKGNEMLRLVNLPDLFL
ncbi:MAG: ATP-binding protein [Spirochaetales bacterium]|nr:ATP-binding protein [Spirochaetales bacterium]